MTGPQYTCHTQVLHAHLICTYMHVMHAAMSCTAEDILRYRFEASRCMSGVPSLSAKPGPDEVMALPPKVMLRGCYCIGGCYTIARSFLAACTPHPSSSTPSPMPASRAQLRECDSHVTLGRGVSGITGHAMPDRQLRLQLLPPRATRAPSAPCAPSSTPT